VQRRVLISSENSRRPKPHRGWLRTPARFHQSYCWLGGVAVRRARTAADFDDSPHRHSPSRKRVSCGAFVRGISSGTEGNGLGRGTNIAFEYRSADGKENALPKIAVELVQLRLDAILAEGTAATQAAKDATQSIPIVMATSSDPVASGLITTLNQPGGNVTGLSLQSSELAGKRLQLLTEIIPKLARLVVLSNPTNPSHAHAVQQMRAASRVLTSHSHLPSEDRSCRSTWLFASRRFLLLPWSASKCSNLTRKRRCLQ
jgi:ABC transporter substrate binding protein